MLGAQRLSGYAAGGRGGDDCGERGAAAETKRAAPSARVLRPEGSLRLAARRLAPLSSSGIRRPRGRETRACPHHPGPSSLPGPPAGSATRRGPSSVCLGPGAWHPARSAEGFGGIGTLPATYRLPCPAPSSRALLVQPLLGSARKRAPTLGALRLGGRSSGSKRALITRLSGS